MDFTYDAYRGLIQTLRTFEYGVISYHSKEDNKRSVILRHDIDYSLEKSLKLAKLEKEEGIKSTYFVLVTSDFYNPFSAKNAEIIHQIMNYGHEIGLHFDEMAYPQWSCADQLTERILGEAKLLREITGTNVKVVSMHRPSSTALEENLEIPGMINSYGRQFFVGFKYISDSRHRWREDPDDVISSGKWLKLHILTHAFWYNDRKVDIHETISRFVNGANRERYESLGTNITALESIMKEQEIAE